MTVSVRNKTMYVAIVANTMYNISVNDTNISVTSAWRVGRKKETGKSKYSEAAVGWTKTLRVALGWKDRESQKR